MVQNQPTISASMLSRGLPPSQVLAEGQKSADVKHDFTILPSPPAKTVGGGGRISREICRFSPFGPSFGGEGSILREKCRVSGNHQHNRKGRFIRLANDGNSLAENDAQLGHAMAAERAAEDFNGANGSDS